MKKIYTIQYTLANEDHTDIFTSRQEWTAEINNKSVYTHYFRHIDPIIVEAYELEDDIKYTADHTITDGSIVFAHADADISDEDNWLQIKPFESQKVQPISIVEEDGLYRTEDEEYSTYEEAYDLESPAQYLHF